MKDSYSSWIDENPILTFIIEELVLRLSYSAEYSYDVKEKKLFEILTTFSPNQLPNQLINDFENLLCPYKLFVKLSDNFTELLILFGNKILITPKISIVLINESFLK